MRLAITLAAVLGLLFFLASDSHAAKKSSGVGESRCAGGTCSVAQAPATVPESRAVVLPAPVEVSGKTKRVRSGRGLHLRLPRLFKGCKGCR